MSSTTVTGKRVTMTAAGTGVLAGVVGLALLASPATADPAPTLPKVTPQALVQSVLDARPVAMNGTVEVDNELGLPSIPGTSGGASMLSAGKTDAQVFTNGSGKARIALGSSASTGPNAYATHTVVDDGTTVWTYDSKDRSVTKMPVPADAGKHAMSMDPATAARNLVGKLSTSSTVSVNGTASVAGRKAYELVLTPKPTEHTLVRQVRVAIDSQLRLPLQLDVYANGSPDPALRVGFTSLSVGKQDPSLFTFTPPAGSKVTTIDTAHAKKPGSMALLDFNVLGNGWDTVVTAKLPAKALTSTGSPSTGHGAFGEAGNGGSENPMQLLSKVGKRVSGPWGSGYLVSTKLGDALITTDGRIAVGFVPQQELTKALGAK